MRSQEIEYNWSWQLSSSPEKLWPYIADTDRFNKDSGLPPVNVVENKEHGIRELSFKRFGVPIAWEEQPFDWVWPRGYGVRRIYKKGPIKALTIQVKLTPNKKGTLLNYQVKVTPKPFIGNVASFFQVQIISRRSFGKIFHRYDELAQRKNTMEVASSHHQLTTGARQRIEKINKTLESLGFTKEVLAKLESTINYGDDFSLAHMRPYKYARLWKADPKRILELFLFATREGLLQFEWDIICPLCRGVQEASPTLKDVPNKVHCDSCQVDVTTNFEKSVEITFHPNPLVRKVMRRTFCVAGPQVTPHILAQQTIDPGSKYILHFGKALETGAYRLRVLGAKAFKYINVNKSGKKELKVNLPKLKNNTTDTLNPRGSIDLINISKNKELAVFERTAWSDDVTSASDIIALQTFRDLFSSEALRPGQKLSVGSVAIVFTDLKGSTKMYQEVGDAKAFGHVMRHFDILERAIGKGDGAIVKTIGDAVMAVFKRPVYAVNAMLEAQKELAKFKDPTLQLKAGVHYGPALAVNLNNRLDYFGTTVNRAARLEGQATENSVVVTQIVADDPEVKALLKNRKLVTTESFKAVLKGFEGDEALLRIRGKNPQVNA